MNCERCGKPLSICVCDKAKVVAIKREVIVLQHPQEQDRDLGTVPLIEATLGDKATRVIGLSWPSLSAALGREVKRERYALLYPAALKKELPPTTPGTALAVDKNGDPLTEPLDGIVVLDGSWSQAKTLWWRNAWVLKHPRVIITPKEASLYGKLRKEPRREYVSTLEAVADALSGLGEPEEARTELRRLFRTMLQRRRDT